MTQTRMKKKYLFNVFFLVNCLFMSSVFSEDIKIGMSTALSGPAKELGQNMKKGVEACFKEINDQGGIDGRMIKLIALDDGYEPDRTGPNMNRLIDDEKVLAVIGNVGTPTAIKAVPIANEKKCLLYGCFTGAGVLRKDPPDRYVINYRASYAEETASMVNGLTQYADVKPEEFAFFTQNDGYGQAGYNGAIKALKNIGFLDAELLSHGRYTRNTKQVLEGLTELLYADVPPKAIIMVGAYAPCAVFIILAKEQFPEAYFLNVSFVGSVPLANVLDDLMVKHKRDGAPEGVIVTQCVPPFDSDLPIVKKYRKAIREFDQQAEFGFVSLEGYISATIFVEGLKRASKNLNRETIIDAIENINDHDIGIGFPINYSKDNHQASHKVWPTRIVNRKYELIEWNSLKK